MSQFNSKQKQQFYYIRPTGLIIDEPQKIIVHSYSELREYMHDKLDWIRSDFINQSDEDTTIKHIYKRVRRSIMYRESENSVSNQGGLGIPIGYVFELIVAKKNGEIDSICYWCEKINKSNIGAYSGFKEPEY